MNAMENTCAIIWTATQRGRFGVGTKRFSREEAEVLAKQLNEDHGEFLHGVIDMATEDPATVLAAMKSADLGAEAQIVDYPQAVAAEAAAIEPQELVPELDDKVIWLKQNLPEVS